MYHIGNLGSYGSQLCNYVDQDGYVPEASDSDSVSEHYHESWHTDSGEAVCDDAEDCGCLDAWSAMVAEAVRLTAEAEAELAEWQQS